MTHQIYSQQQLQLKSIARLKQIYSEIGCTVEVSDKRCKDSWITAITEYQTSKVQKLTFAAPDEQALAQAELDHHIATQAQAIAPEPLTTKEISFYDHEIYSGNHLIATISHDDDLTQPWVVMVEGKEKFRANTYARCHRFIQWHHQESTLSEPLPTQTQTPCTTENRIMAHIFNECEKYGFEILDDGIYNNNGVKLGQVGCTDGNWWVKRRYSVQQQYSNSVLDAVRSLSMVDVSVSTDGKSIFDEYFLDQPLEQLTGDRLQRLLERTELVTA
ncbi:hypothetical protein [Nostoc sp. 'Peltigera membranacea cyanobiont' N6]|uniref:hypothetical protein n=1 Tax=Nostoc sp. 'Peltigera membranacea cyanobiont' N6 TaxID=1261031 RepID=UPI000CF34CED|nr:hypothetical protein [Nostoc sp. 'Peltigera membranacea cyanobiont' N6]AVH63869.1 hypothetical protein NPM_2131 [Nostoc sp. 'Peltigera membranacea cyanobiont' N6]